MADININRGSAIIATGTKKISTSTKALNSQFIADILKGLDQMDTKSGMILSNNQKNRDFINATRGNVRGVLNKVGYFGNVKQYLVNFDELSKFQKDIHKQLNGISIKSSQITPFRRWAVDKVLYDLQGQGLDVNLINPIRQEMRRAVSTGGNWLDMKRNIENFLRQGKNGHLVRLVQLGSQDALGQFDGVVNDAVRKEFKLNGIAYVGSLVDDSRPQCERWVNEGTLNWDTLGNEIEWARKNGTGWIKGTKKSNFFQNRGGHRCRHTAIPKRL